MSMFRSQAVAALRKVENDESFDESDVAITVIALNRIIREGRTPFQRQRDHYIIGTERFPVLSGLDYLRVILMHQKNTIRHSGTNLGEISAVEVYTALQSEPPQPYNSDPEGATSEEYAFDLLGFAPYSDVGPSGGGPLQVELDRKAMAWLSHYAEELKKHDSIAAVEKAQYLEHWLRKHELGPDLGKLAKDDEHYIEPGDLEGVVKASNRKYFYRGNLRAFRKPSQNIADNVRKSVNYALDALRKNPRALDIANHLKDNITTGQVCEYTGGWKWLFLEKN